MSKSKRAGAVKPRLVILGTADSIGSAPFEDESIEIWAVQTALAKDDLKRADRVFEMHPRRYWGDPNVQERINKFKGPVYMQAHNDEIPNSVEYPYDEIKDKFFLPVMKENLFVTNTITWMMLLAIYEGYRDISLFGVHMAHETEYGYQQASLSWALGIIHGLKLKGEDIKLYIHPSSELLTARYEYGYGEPSQSMAYLKKRMQGLSAGVNKARSEVKELNERILRTEGAREEARAIYERLAGFK